MTIVDVITVIIICVLLVILLALMAFVLIDFLKSREGRRMVRTMKDVCSTILACMSPSTLLQKEIREEERTIKQLEAQRADMQRLEELRRKREALFEEVGDKHVDRVEPHSEEIVIVTVDGYQIPHTFTSKESANNYVERFHPKAKEIEMRGRFTL